MTGKNLGLAAIVALWTYLLLTLFLGNRGLIAYATLLDYRDRLASHIEELGSLQEELSAAATRLQSDPEQVRIEARRMGYVAPSEGMIRIPGRSVPDQLSNSPGDKLPAPARWSVERTLFRALALTIGLAAFVLLQTMRRDSK